jgi:hypothetical protein
MPEAVVKGELRPLRRRVCSWFKRPTAIVATAPCNSLRN